MSGRFAGAAAAMIAAVAQGDVNLELRPVCLVTDVGGAADLGLYAVSDDPVESELVSAMQVVFQWQPKYLELLGLDQTGATDLLSSSFPVQLLPNEADPPADGDAVYQALADFGMANAIVATPEGTLITTFQFDALLESDLTTVEIVPSVGRRPNETLTRVFSGSQPNTIVTGTLGSADVIIGDPCPADTDDSGAVDVDDLVAVILSFGSVCDPDPCDTDINGDGIVDVDDLVEVILTFGRCDDPCHPAS